MRIIRGSFVLSLQEQYPKCEPVLGTTAKYMNQVLRGQGDDLGMHSSLGWDLDLIASSRT